MSLHRLDPAVVVGLSVENLRLHPHDRVAGRQLRERVMVKHPVVFVRRADKKFGGLDDDVRYQCPAVRSLWVESAAVGC